MARHQPPCAQRSLFAPDGEMGDGKDGLRSNGNQPLREALMRNRRVCRYSRARKNAHHGNAACFFHSNAA